MTQAAQLLARFEKVCSCLKEENSLLQADDLTRVVEVVPRKQVAMQELEEQLAAARETPEILQSAEVEQAVRQFNALAQINHQLLKKAVEVQSEIVSLILENVAQDQRSGYGASGHYAVNKDVSGAFTLSSDV
ncbi:MAG: hypothetical protein L0I33_03230 [Acetobacter sp.]|nr:hypothetical protein [Acetobacter sp.]